MQSSPLSRQVEELLPSFRTLAVDQLAAHFRGADEVRASAAFTVLLEQFGRAINNSSGRLVGNSREAEDYLQECWLHVQNSRRALTHDNWCGWAQTVIRRKIVDIQRRRCREHHPCGREPTATADPLAEDPAAGLHNGELREQLNRAIQALAHRDPLGATVFVLRHPESRHDGSSNQEALGNNEVAAQLGISAPRASGVYGRARAFLQQYMRGGD